MYHFWPNVAFSTLLVSEEEERKRERKD